MKREWWGSPLVQEKYQEEKACDKGHPYRIIIIIIIIIICSVSHWTPLPHILSLMLCSFHKAVLPCNPANENTLHHKSYKLPAGTQPSPPHTIGDTKSFDVCLLSELCAAQQAAARPLCTPHRRRVYILLGTHEVPGSNLNPDRQTHRVCVVSPSPSTVALPARSRPRP